MIAPAGPRVAPEKTKLAGPKVVRIEKPDPVAPPRRQREAGLPGSAPATPGGPSVGRSSPGGGGVRNTRRRDQSRGGGGAGAKNRGLGEVTPFDWRQQDYADREQRLQKSEGFLDVFAGMFVKKMCPPAKRQFLKQTGGSAAINLQWFERLRHYRSQSQRHRPALVKGQPLRRETASSRTSSPWS